MADLSALIFVLFSLAVNSVHSNALFIPNNQPQSVIKSCTADCIAIVSVNSNSITNGDSCSRGCRLFILANFVPSTRDWDLNTSRSSCLEMCKESYGINEPDLLACRTGCDVSNAPIIQVPVVAEISWSLLIDSLLVDFEVAQGDAPEGDEVLTEPGLRSQVSRLESRRLPQVSLRTLPIETILFVVVILIIFSEYINGFGTLVGKAYLATQLYDISTAKRNERGVNEGGTVDCRGLEGLPYSFCLVWSLLLLLLLCLLWSCLSATSADLQSLPPQEKLPLV